jgi:succinate dehydrogenase/fumarate reductase flavoprotein subunit
MASFDYDVVIIGSGFRGVFAALRAADKGCRGRRRIASEGNGNTCLRTLT